MAKLERELFYAAYAVRKLIDAFKISDEVEKLFLVCKEHRRKDRIPDLQNRDRIDELFVLSRPRRHKITLREFCNQVIHSFVFVPCMSHDSNGLAGIFIASDWQKDRGLLYIDINEVIRILKKVALDDIVYERWERSGVGMLMRVIQKSSRLGRRR